MFVYHNVILIQTQIPIYAKYFSLQKTKKYVFALAIREDIDASIKSVGCKYIKIVPNK